jgi:anaerobic dimethyl sulfoxide reductase subunit C (anchor subunit)
VIYILTLGFLLISLWLERAQRGVITALGWLAILSGFVTDFCMSQIYLLPSQPAWNSLFTPISFLVTTFLLGVLTIPVLFTMDLIFKKSQGQDGQAIHAHLIDQSLGGMAILAIILCILMATIVYFQIAALFSGNVAAQTSLNLLLNIYEPLLIIRLVFLFIGAGWLGYMAAQHHQRRVASENLLLQVFIPCLLVMVAEILGRFLFFAIHVRIGI